MVKVRVNDDDELVNEIKTKLKENDGYCPCALEHNRDTMCMCKEFRDKLQDESFTGPCHCGLYILERG